MTAITKALPPTPLILLLGTTASGKTRLAVRLAQTFGGEIISVDSRQVYRRMDIGTGKDLDEYGHIPTHLIDIAEPETDYSLFDFARDFGRSFEAITQRGNLAIAAGGTGLYLDALLNRYALQFVPENPARRKELEPLGHAALIEILLKLAPQQHNTSDLKERERTLRAIEIAEAKEAQTLSWPEFRPLVLGLKPDRDNCRARITARLKQRLDHGMIEEVQQLQQNGLSWERLSYFGLEYRFIGQYLQGLLNYNDMFQKLNSAIHEFARQQEKWFRKMERQGHVIHWLPVDESNEKESNEVAAHALIRQFLDASGKIDGVDVEPN